MEQQQALKERSPSADAQPLLPSQQLYRQKSATLLQQTQCNQQRQAPTAGSALLGQQSASKSTLLLLCAVLLLCTVFRIVSRDFSSNSSSPANEAVSSGSNLLRLGSNTAAGSGTAFEHLAGSSSSSSTSDSPSRTNDMYSSSMSGQDTLDPPCAYGSLPGTWVSTSPAGERWQVLDPECQLTNWLAVYAFAGQNSSANGTSTGLQGAVKATQGDSSSSSSSNSSDTARQADSADMRHPPMVGLLLLSDSVDRFIVEHVCSVLGGTKETHMMRPTVDSEEAERAAAEAMSRYEATQQQQQQPQAAGPQTGPTLLNKTAYAFHTCESAAPIKLASSYFPGVHPTGPYHRFSAQNYRKRIDSAREMWVEYAGEGQEPDMISVAALLWDVARMYMHERDIMEGREELERALLDGWVQNYTAVVNYAHTVFPQTKLWITHTTMPPRHDKQTGLMSKPYLGRLYFIHQLNAAAATAARMLGMQLVDYEAIAERFIVGQQHLIDLIHPNAMLGLEVFNVMLNLVTQQQQQQQEQLQALDGSR